MDDYCDNRHCRHYRLWMFDPGPYCLQCGNPYHHRGRYDHHNQQCYDRSRRDQESRNVRDLIPYRSRSRSQDYDRTYHHRSIVQETRDHNRATSRYGYDGRPLSYAYHDSHRERTPSPSYRPRERGHRESRQERSPSPQNRYDERRPSSSARYRPRERSRYKSNRRRSRSRYQDYNGNRYESSRRRYSQSRERSTPLRSRRSERRRSSSSHYRTYEQSPYQSNGRRTPSPTYRDRDGYYGSRRRSSSSTYEPRSRYSDRDSINDYRSDRRGDQGQDFESQHDDSRRGQRELISYVPAESPPRSITLPWSARQPEQEFGIHGEDFDLKDIRQKRFINCGIECHRCKDEGYEADHPRFACGTMFEIFTHYVGDRLRNKHEWCQICKKEGRFNISKHHSTEECKFGMWCDHPANDSVKQKAKFRKWNYPYPSEILGYEPGTVSQMFRDMKHRQREPDD